MPKQQKETKKSTEVQLQEETVVDTTTNQEETEVQSDIIEIEWTEIEEVYNLRANLNAAEQHLAAMCVDFEKTKQSYVNQILQTEVTLNNMGLEVLKSKNCDITKSYELKMPTSVGEKAYFIKK